MGECLKMGDVLNKEQKDEVMEAFTNQYGEDEANELTSSGGNSVDVEDEEDEVEIVESKQSIDFSFLTENMLRTDHLTNYDVLDLDLSLDGDNYKAMKKGLWYFHHSLKQQTRSYVINRKTRIDNRKHLLIFTPPAGGKSTTKNQVKRIMDDKDLIETSGISHPEQLIGKTKYKGTGKNRISYPNYGVLGYKCVLYDEAQDMINEKDSFFAKAQRVKRIAMDNFGENKISKKLVDDSKEDVLEYHPECRIIDFAHPQKLNSRFFDTGSFRRYDIFNLVHEEVIDVDSITDFKLDDEVIKSVDYNKVLNKQYKKSREDVQFNQQTLDIISYFHKSLLHFLLNHKNTNAFRYALLTRYSLRNIFCKNILILSLARNESVPNLETTISACTDTLLFILKSIEAINDLGDMGLSTDLWGGVSEEDAQVLEYVYRKKALSKEDSKISIKRFCTILGNIYGCKITQSRAHFYRLKRDGFVDSKRKTGDLSSRVWLKFIPKEIKINSKEEEPLKFWRKQLVTVGYKKALLIVTNDYFTDDKTMKKIASVGSVGIWGCMLVNYYICAKHLKKNKNKIYIYNTYPTTPTLPTVTKIPIPTATVKQPKPTIKTPISLPTVTPVKIIKEDGRSTQFFEAKECENIKPKHTKKDVLKWIKNNPKYTAKELNKKFGVGSLKFRNELKREKLI